MSETARPPLRRVAVLIPTYNERDTLPVIVPRLLEVVPEVDVVVLDDNSPDGTGAVADALAEGEPRVHVIHRPRKEGLGAAYLEGFAWALDRGYDAVVEMDADGSHRPEHLPDLLAAAAEADVVIGSRWVRGGSVVNWPLHRKALSVGGNLYVKVLLGMPVHDATAGFRVYRADALHVIGLHDVASQGYCFQTDLTWRAVRADLTVVEVPITFVEREVGDSKMSRHIMTESLRLITGWGVRHRTEQVRGLLGGRREPQVALVVSTRGRVPSDTPRRRPRVLRWVFLALLVLPILEIAVIIAVGRVIGGWQTLVLLVLESLLGAWIVKREGSRTGWPCRRRCAAAGCRADSSPTPRWSSSAARCC